MNLSKRSATKPNHRLNPSKLKLSPLVAWVNIMSCDVGLYPNQQPYTIFGLEERWEKGKEKEGREVICLVWLDERREKWVDLEWLFLWGFPFCYHSQIGWKERKRERNFGIIIIFIIKLPIYLSILILNHIFEGIEVNNYYFSFHFL